MSRLGTVGLCALVLGFFVGAVQAAEEDPFADTDNGVEAAAGADDDEMPAEDPDEAAARTAKADDDEASAEDESEMAAPAAKADDAKAPVAEIEAEGIRPIEVATVHEALARAKIKRALDEETAFEFFELPLDEVVSYLRDKHEVEIQLDAKVLEEASIGVDTPVTRKVSGITLRSALRLMLGALDLTYTVKDEALLITTPAAAKRETMVRIYPVGDLIAADRHDKHGRDSAALLIEVIKGTVGSNTWQEGGGTGSIQPWALGKSLVIRQTLAGHEEIGPLLSALRRSRDVESRRGNDPTVVTDH